MTETKEGLSLDSGRIIILAPSSALPTAVTLAGIKAECYRNYQDLRESSARVLGFVIRAEQEEHVTALAREIRRDPDQCCALIFLMASSIRSNALTDGPLPPVNKLSEHLRVFHARLAAIAQDTHADTPDALLLKYLWLRPDQVLAPVSDWRRPRRYAYPVLEALDRTESDPETWLNKLDQAGLLERVTLKDRQRECDYCGSAHLSFTDVCPSCRSIDIDRHAALHCFTCGLIAPEERFQRGEQRVCPKCGTRLRHIGSDYDRPLETYCCKACEHVFIEGEVISRCAVCQHSMSPGSLRLHKVFSWRLSPLGKLAAQGRAITAAHSTPQLHRTFVPVAHFIENLDWMLRIVRERGGIGFSLMSLHLDNRKELEESLGQQRSAALLLAFAERLRELLSDVDFATQTEADSIHLLLPNGTRKQLDALEHRFGDLNRQAQQGEEGGPRWTVKRLTITDRLAHSSDAHSLLEQLTCKEPAMPPSARRRRFSLFRHAQR